MNRLQIFRLLRHNNNLGYRRSPAFEQSMVAKVMMLIGGAVFVLYLIVYGVIFYAVDAAHRLWHPLHGAADASHAGEALYAVAYSAQFSHRKLPTLVSRQHLQLALVGLLPSLRDY